MQFQQQTVGTYNASMVILSQTLNVGSVFLTTAQITSKYRYLCVMINGNVVGNVTLSGSQSAFTYLPQVVTDPIFTGSNGGLLKYIPVVPEQDTTFGLFVTVSSIVSGTAKITVLALVDAPVTEIDTNEGAKPVAVTYPVATSLFTTVMSPSTPATLMLTGVRRIFHIGGWNDGTVYGSDILLNGTGSGNVFWHFSASYAAPYQNSAGFDTGQQSSIYIATGAGAGGQRFIIHYSPT